MGDGNPKIGVELSLGTLLVGAFINTFLFGVIVHQFIVYYTSRLNDPRWIRNTVHALVAIDVTHSLIIIYVPWYYIVNHFNNPAAIMKPVWAYLITPIFQGLAAVLTQTFLAYRLYRLNRRRDLHIFLLVFISLSFVGDIGAGMTPFAMGLESMSRLNEYRWMYIAWLTLHSTVDITLSVSLALEFYAFKGGRSKSDRMLGTIMRKTIQTGAFATIFSLLTGFTQFYWENMGSLGATFAFPMGRIYTNALMDTLLMRSDLREVFTPAENLTEIVERDLRNFGYGAVPEEPDSDTESVTESTLNA